MGVKPVLLLGMLIVAALVCGVPGKRRGPRDKPKNVSVELVNATTVIVRWEAPRPIPRCAISKYLIRLKDEGLGRGTSHKVNGSIPMVIIKNLREDTDYLIRVVAISCRGKSQPTKWASIRTLSRPMGDGKHDFSEMRAPGKPSDVRTRTMTDAIIMSWQPPDDDILVRGYMVGYGEGVPDVNWQYVSADTRNFTIRNLKPSTQYVISLRAFNNYGKGPVVYDLIYTRDEDAPTVGPLTPPIGLKSRVLSPHTVWLEWIDPSLGRAQKVTDNRYYVVAYTPMPQGETRTLTVKMLNVVLYHLTPYTTFEFKVLTHKEGESTAYSISNYNTTFEAAPGSPPKDLTLKMANVTTTMVVTWRPPDLPNGVLTGFILSYSPLPVFSDKEWTLVRIQPHLYSYTVTDLISDRNYGVKMQAVNAKGYGPYSSTAEFYTGVREGGEYSTTTIRTSTVLTSTLPWDNLSLEMERAFRRQEQERAASRARAHQQGAVQGPGQPEAGSNEVELIPEPAKRTRPASSGKSERSEPRTRPTPRPPEVGGTSGGADTSGDLTTMSRQAGPRVTFSAAVSHVVSAVVTWAETSVTCQSAEKSHYVFSYHPTVAPSAVKMVNVTSPLIVLIDLQANTQYDYEVRKFDDVTNEEQWVRTGSVDTYANGGK